MNNNPDVAIITLNYNHSKETLECLNSIQKSSYTNYKVFVVDNGSEQEDYEKLKSAITDNCIRIIRQEPNIGYVGGVNLGLEKASVTSPDYYLIMNNDILLDKDTIKELVYTANKYSGNAIVSGKVYNMDEPETLQYIGQWCRNSKKLDYPPYVKGGREKDNGQYEHEMELGMADDIFWLLPHKIFEAVGYYSTDFFLYGEQNDYVLRTLQQGFKLIYTPKAKIWHYHHLTTAGGDLKSLKVCYWRSYAVLLLKYKYLKKLLFISSYFDFLFRNIIKTIFYSTIVKNIERQKKAKVNFLVFKYFTKWLFGKRKPNDGFNPIKDKI
jgi:GT2 family glycosyltransferase